MAGSLYGDIKLDDQLENLEYKEKYEALAARTAEEAEELKALRDKVATLAASNETLERNICCLYNTAVREIQRKDAIIKDLRHQLNDKTVALAKMQSEADGARSKAPSSGYRN